MTQIPGWTKELDNPVKHRNNQGVFMRWVHVNGEVLEIAYDGDEYRILLDHVHFRNQTFDTLDEAYDDAVDVLKSRRGKTESEKKSSREDIKQQLERDRMRKPSTNPAWKL